MNERQETWIRLVARRSWNPESTVAVCNDLVQAKKHAAAWKKKLADMIWSDSSLILDPPHLFYEAQVGNGKAIDEEVFDDVRDLSDWLRSKEEQ
jgi:hypothetical protein